MKTILKLLNLFFVTLGVIFFGILLFAGYMWYADPYGVKPIVKSLTGSVEITPLVNSDEDTSTSLQSGSTATEAQTTKQVTSKPVSDTSPSAADSNDRNPLLSAEQEAQLQTLGIDPATLPQEITPEMATCAEAELGSERVAEIKAGATPSVAEFFKARDCFF